MIANPQVVHELVPEGQKRQAVAQRALPDLKKEQRVDDALVAEAALPKYDCLVYNLSGLHDLCAHKLSHEVKPTHSVSCSWPVHSFCLLCSFTDHIMFTRLRIPATMAVRRCVGGVQPLAGIHAVRTMQTQTKTARDHVLEVRRLFACSGPLRFAFGRHWVCIDWWHCRIK